MVASALFLVSCRSAEEEVSQSVTTISWRVEIHETHDNFGSIIAPWYSLSLMINGEEEFYLNHVSGILIDPWDTFFQENAILTLSSADRHVSPWGENGFAVYKISDTELEFRQYALGSLDIGNWVLHTFSIEEGSEIIIEEEEIIFAEPTIINMPFSLEELDIFMLENYTSVFFNSRAMVAYMLNTNEIYDNFENGVIQSLPSGMREDGFVAGSYHVIEVDGEMFVILYWDRVLYWENSASEFFDESFKYMDGQFVKTEEFVLGERTDWPSLNFINWIRTERIEEMIANHPDVIMWNENFGSW
ncbi:MAG: hypothetical protein FWD82_03885 [Defluviitaleaceae bacterium]|nr:hypothetical protein [Defluviitaleaceae bacterium]